jgi:hypothetical protein
MCLLSDRFYKFHSELILLNVDKKRFSLVYEGVSKSFRTGRLDLELQMVELSATRCSCIAIL